MLCFLRSFWSESLRNRVFVFGLRAGPFNYVLIGLHSLRFHRTRQLKRNEWAGRAPFHFYSASGWEIVKVDYSFDIFFLSVVVGFGFMSSCFFLFVVFFFFSFFFDCFRNLVLCCFVRLCGGVCWKVVAWPDQVLSFFFVFRRGDSVRFFFFSNISCVVLRNQPSLLPFKFPLRAYFLDVRKLGSFAHP